MRNEHEGIEIAPQLFDGTVLFSTVPSNVTGSYRPGTLGVVWALDAATGAPRWHFDTVEGGAALWGKPDVNGGGGLWYPPAVDDRGRVFLAVGNPAPFPGTKEYPNGSSRPGPNLYTNSLVALDGRTGKLLWYRQAVPHDLRDYDLAISPDPHPADGGRGRCPRRDHGRQDGQGLRLPRRRRQAALEHRRSAGTRTTPGR